MRRIRTILLLLVLIVPLVGCAEEPFMFRGRYTWGMSADEVKQLAAEEGLSLKYKEESFLSYQNVPVAGIIAEELSFHMDADGLSTMFYAMIVDTKEVLAWYPRLLEQLTLLYGECDEAESQQLMDEWQLSIVSVWRRADVFIVLVGENSGNVCRLGYLREYPLPTPSPTPTPPVPFTSDGL